MSQWSRFQAFVGRRFHENRSFWEIGRTVRRAKLLKEETRVLAELEYEELITHRQQQLLLAKLGKEQEQIAEPLEPDTIAKIMGEVKGLRARAKKELEGLIDREEVATIKRVFRAKIEEVIRGGSKKEEAKKPE